MSTIRRVASGTLASWLRIIVNLVAQVALVPIYLAHWSAETYGTWIALFAVAGFVNFFSLGYQNYLGNEFLQLAQGAREEMWSKFRGALKAALWLALFELSAAMLCVVFGVAGRMIPPSANVSPADIALVLGVYIFVWSLTGSLGGIAVRLLSALGHFHRMAWWGVWAAAMLALAPAVAVLCGAGLLGAGLAAIGAVVFYNLPFYWDMWFLLRREGLASGPSDLKWARKAWMRSHIITIRTFLENLRQQGVRVLLAPLAGTRELAAFTTMRTGANVALQGIGSITQPLLPELMRYLHRGDQARSEAAFAPIGFVIIVGLAPGVVLLQVLAPVLYEWWTVGKMAFDPLLFAMLSLSVVIFATSQTAAAIVQGHNLLRPQLIVAILASVVTVVGLFGLVPRWGLKGAGLVLLVAEVIAAIGYRASAIAWLSRRQLCWPHRSQGWIDAAVMFCAIMLVNAAKKTFPGWLVVGGSVPVFAMIGWAYWNSLPEMAKTRFLEIINRVLSKTRTLTP